MTQRLTVSRAELVAVAAALGLIDDPGAPPRQLWDRILGRLRSEPSLWHVDEAAVTRRVRAARVNHSLD